MLRFEVEGSKGDIYEIFAEKAEDRLFIKCNCGAGQNGMYCKHRFALLDGDVSNLRSENFDDVERLAELAQGSDVERALKEVTALLDEQAQLRARVSKAKRKLANAMYEI